MRILLITEDFPPGQGGVATVLHNICLFTKANIHALTVQMKDAEDFDRTQPYPITRLRLLPRLGFIILLTKALWLAVAQRPSAVFWGHCPSAVVVGGLLKAILGIPLVVFAHRGELDIALSANFISQFTTLFTLRRCDLILVNSRYFKQRLSDLGLPLNHIHVLNLGVDPDRFRPDVNADSIREKYCLAGKKILLTVARLVEVKNHSTILKALPQIIEHIPNLAYLIVGDGPERENLQDLARELQLDEHAIFVGPAIGETLVQLFNICDVFIMISKVETFGIVFLEAGACGKPVIGPNLGGVPEAVIHGVTGLLVDPESEEEVSEAILELLLNPDKARKMGENGRAHAVNEQSWTKVAARFDEAMRAVVTRHRP